MKMIPNLGGIGIEAIVVPLLRVPVITIDGY